MLVLTAPILDGKKVVEYKGLVISRDVRALNVFRDIFTAFRDFFGGRSNSYQEVMQEMQQELIAELKREAQMMGANAIIGFSLDFDNVGSKGKSLLMAAAQGTAVVIE